MKVVFDTNIFISMLIWRNKELEPLYDLFRQKQITACINSRIIQEIIRVLNYPRFIIPILKADLTPEEIIKTLTDYCLIFSSRTKMPEIINEDPSDNVILSCALASNADFIISGDKHLLRLKSFQGIPILTPQQFLTRFRKIK